MAALLLYLFFCIAVHGSGLFPDNCAVRLLLGNGLASGSKAAPENYRDLDLHLERRHGRWQPHVWGFARRYNQSNHEGVVRVLAQSPDTTRLRVEMLVMDDPWVEGGFAEYEISLTRSADAAPKGRHAAWFNGADLSGPVAAAVSETVPRSAVLPLTKGEHPRLLFRRHRLPELRERAGTEWGDRILDALRARLATEPGPHDSLGRAMGHGFLYAVFGEEEHGAAGAELVRRRIWDLRGGGGHAHDVARGLQALALAFDLVYDQLTPRDLDLLAKQLTGGSGIVNLRKGLHGNWNNGPNSNWTAIGTGGAGVAALAMLRERGRLGVIPPTPCIPAEQFEATTTRLEQDGDAAWEFRPDTLITNWLHAGPLQPVEMGRVPASLGDPSALAPRIGTAFVHEGREFSFTPLPPTALQSPKVEFLDNVPACLVLPGADSSSITYLHTVVQAPAGISEGIFRCLHPAGFRGARVWIDGRPVPEGAGVRLDPGLHRLLLEVTGPVVYPRFSSAAVGPMLGKWRRFRRLAAEYEQAAGRYRDTGERQDPPILLSTVRRHAAAWATHALGDRGWKTETETYQLISLAMLLPFAMAYENVTGEPLAAGTGLEWVAPLGLARQCASGGGGYGSKGAMGLPSSFLAYGINLSRPELRPALLWELDRRLGSERSMERMSCHDLVNAYVNYPADITARHPSEVMPTVIADRRKGMFIFRNRYLDADDIVTHLFLQAERPRGPAWFLREVGSFRISGLGTAWAVGGGQGKRGKEYTKENVVVVGPDTGRGIGRTLYFEQPEDGVGIVGGDLSGFHNAPTNYGVRASRHFAVDYTGVSGSDALFAVVDSVTGGEWKKWTMHTAGTPTSAGASFTIADRRRKASLHGLFVSPADASVTTSNRVLHVRSDTKHTDFFAVMTLQKDKAPEIIVKGNGLGTRVTVGGRVVQFTGERLVLGRKQGDTDEQ